MKIILKNTSMKFKTYTPKLTWTDSELKSAEGYVTGSLLNQNTGDVTVSSSDLPRAVSPVIYLANASQIVITALNYRYISIISFFNSQVSTTTSVYHKIGTNAGEITESVTIDSSIIQAAVALGADSFRITMDPTATSSVAITQ